MIQHQPYYIDPNDPDDWKQALKDAATITLMFIAGVALCAIFSSCTSPKVIERTDTLRIVQKDTVRTTEVKEKKVTSYVDRWRNNTYVINPLTGDTTKQVIKEKVLIAFSQEQHDSILHYKAMYDSLLNIRKNDIILQPQQKQLSWWQKFKCDTYMYLFISLLATMAAWIAYHFYHNKRP